MITERTRVNGGRDNMESEGTVSKEKWSMFVPKFQTMSETAWKRYISTDISPTTLSSLTFRQPNIFEDVATDSCRYISLATEFLPTTGDEPRNLTLGCVVQPLAPTKDDSEFEIPVIDKSGDRDEVARCKSCQAVLNKYCSRDSRF